MILLRWLDDLLSLFYPKLCQACGKSLFYKEEIICLQCKLHLPKTGFHLEKDNALEQFFWGRVPFVRASAFLYFVKKGNIQHLIHRLKYKGKEEIGIYLGKLYGKELIQSEDFRSIDFIVPVPLHLSKLKLRGYNQSELFANGLSESMNVPVNTTILIRQKASETQTRKSRFKRWENVKEIFTIENGEIFENKHLLLVDDVITTGATLESCAGILLKIPGVKVSVASIAVAGL
jgi:ComF family protein